MKFDFYYSRKAKSLDTITKILKELCSRVDLKDITYDIKEINNGSLKYQLDFLANWK